MHVISDCEYEIHRNDKTRPFLIGGRMDACKQVFSISEDGTASIELFRDGGVCVTTNGVAAYLPRELPSEINDEQF